MLYCIKDLPGIQTISLFLVLCFTGIVGGAPSPASLNTAELMEMSLEELMQIEVVTASRSAEPLDEAPNVMYVITEEEIKKYGYHQLSDVLSRIPGFFHLFSQNTNQDLMSVRGVVLGENVKVAVMINGHRITNTNESNDLVWPVTLDNVERIEIIVGPGSVLHGSETLLGMVNLITKKMTGVEAVYTRGFSKTGDGIHGNYKSTSDSEAGTLMFGQEFSEERSYFVSATQAHRPEGFHTNYYDHWNDQGPLNQIARGSGFYMGNFAWDGWILQASSLIRRLNKQNNIPEFRSDHVNSFVIGHDLAVNDQGTLKLKYSVDDKRMVRNQGMFNAEIDLHKVEAAFESQHNEHFLQGGLQYNYGLADGTTNGVWAGGINGQINKNSMQTRALFFSDKYVLNDRWTLVGACRLDNSSIIQNDRVYISPRIAAILKAKADWVVKFMFNTATKYPEPLHSDQISRVKNINEGASSGAPWGLAKKPERLYTGEIQSIHYLGKSRLSFNVYYQELQDFIAWYSSSGSTGGGWTNIGDFSGIGAEFDLRTPLTETLSIWANGAYEDTDFDGRSGSAISLDDGARIPYQAPDGSMNQFPEVMLNTGIDYTINDLTVAASVRYFTDLAVLRSGSSSSNAVWDNIRNEYFVDLNFLYDVCSVFDLRFSVKNLLDNRNHLPRQREVGEYAPVGRYFELSGYMEFK